MAVFNNKLSAAEKAEFKNKKRTFKPLFRQCEHSGVTMAVVIHGGGNFYRIAFSYCNELDQFNKKRGKFEALNRIVDNGEFALIPRNGGQAIIAVQELLFN